MIPRVMAPGQSVDRTLAGRRGSWKNRLFPCHVPFLSYVSSGASCTAPDEMHRLSVNLFENLVDVISFVESSLPPP